MSPRLRRILKLLAVLGLLGALGLALVTWACLTVVPEWLVEAQASKKLGADVDVGSAWLDPFESTLELDGVSVKRGEDEELQLARVELVYDLDSVLADDERLRLPRLVFDSPKLTYADKQTRDLGQIGDWLEDAKQGGGGSSTKQEDPIVEELWIHRFDLQLTRKRRIEEANAVLVQHYRDDGQSDAADLLAVGTTNGHLFVLVTRIQVAPTKEAGDAPAIELSTPIDRLSEEHHEHATGVFEREPSGHIHVALPTGKVSTRFRSAFYRRAKNLQLDGLFVSATFAKEGWTFEDLRALIETAQRMTEVKEIVSELAGRAKDAVTKGAKAVSTGAKAAGAKAKEALAEPTQKLKDLLNDNLTRAKEKRAARKAERARKKAERARLKEEKKRQKEAERRKKEQDEPL